MMPRETKRILCLTSNFPRWESDSTTPFVLHLAEDLVELGWEVDVLAPHAPGAALEESFGRVRVSRFRYAWPERAQTVCYQGGALINLQKRPAEKLKLPALVAAEWWAARRQLARRRYDLVHSHWLLPQGFVGRFVSRPAALPHVVTVHGGDVFALRGRALSACKKMVLRSADCVTVNSSVTEGAVRELVAEPPRLERVPMGIEVTELSEEERARAARLRSDQKGLLSLFVGRLVEEKGIFDLLEAHALLVEKYPDAQLWIAGEGQEKERLRARAVERGLASSVRLLGWVQPDEVRLYLAAADVFIGPSKQSKTGWREAQGLTFLEAMSVGTPVVATRSGGIVDSIEHEETGLLVSEGEPGEIAHAVVRLIEERELRQRLVENAGRHVRARFSRDASARHFDRVFRELIGAR